MARVKNENRLRKKLHTPRCNHIETSLNTRVRCSTRPRSSRVTLKRRIERQVCNILPYSHGELFKAEVETDCLFGAFSTGLERANKGAVDGSIGRISFGEYKESRPLRLANITTAVGTNACTAPIGARRVSLSGHNERPWLVVLDRPFSGQKGFTIYLRVRDAPHTRAYARENDPRGRWRPRKNTDLQSDIPARDVNNGR